jgi:adenosylmethionine-8-amino-7-oxononanoate aminotransferase
MLTWGDRGLNAGSGSLRWRPVLALCSLFVMDASGYQRLAKEHLWMHFTRMGEFDVADVPIIVRGDGCYLEDSTGRRYIDALAGLFSVNIGYSFGEEIGQAALDQMRELPFYTNWSYAHPRAIELAAEVASLAPGDLNRVFFCSGGSEAVESAWKLARQYYAARGEKQLRGLVTPGARAGVQEAEVDHDAIAASAATPPRRYKAIARHIAYHGTTMGALSINGIPALRTPFEPLISEVRHVSNTNRYHRPPEETEAQFTEFLLAELEQAILSMGPETVCLVHMEPVQNAGGCFTPPEGYWRGVREICDRYDILLSADEVITAFGRLGHWFASERYDIRPDIVTSAKGLSSSYAAIGAVVATDEVMQAFMGETSMFSHGITFGGHPVMCAIALKNIEIMKRERILEHVRENENAFRSTLAQLLDIPIVGDVRGTGYFLAIELVKDKETRETFSDEECEKLLRGYLSTALWDAGMICRADDRGDPVIQISPPLVAGQAEFDEITGILGEVLTGAVDLMRA